MFWAVGHRTIVQSVGGRESFVSDTRLPRLAEHAEGHSDPQQKREAWEAELAVHHSG